jgi:hypothetical protein
MKYEKVTTVWKTIDEFPCYEVSNTGLVRVLISQKKGISIPGMILKFRPGGSEKKYMRVALIKDGKQRDRYVHRLVCEAFNGKSPENKRQAAHLDGNTKNNNAHNLKWVDAQENSDHKILHGTVAMGQKNPRALLSEENAKKILDLYILGAKSYELAKMFSVSSGTVTSIVSGRQWLHIGSESERKKAKEMCRYNMLEASKRANEKRRQDALRKNKN